MARRGKKGLDYFPLDVDFFNNKTIQLIESEFGSKGLTITLKLLCKIYRNGYYYQWGRDECSLFTKVDMGAEVSPKMVDEVIKGLVRRRFFDEKCYDLFHILTSSGIQRRFLDASGRRLKVDLVEEYCLVDYSKNLNVNILSLNDDIFAESKVKKSKVKNIKENSKEKDGVSFDTPKTIENNKSTLEQRIERFRSTLLMWEGTYSKEIVNQFFVYWSEPNRSKTKMRCELEKTWDLPRRLNTWYQRSKKFTQSKSKTTTSNFASYDNSTTVQRF